MVEGLTYSSGWSEPQQRGAHNVWDYGRCRMGWDGMMWWIDEAHGLIRGSTHVLPAVGIMGGNMVLLRTVLLINYWHG